MNYSNAAVAASNVAAVWMLVSLRGTGSGLAVPAMVLVGSVWTERNGCVGDRSTQRDRLYQTADPPVSGFIIASSPRRRRREPDVEE